MPIDIQMLLDLWNDEFRVFVTEDSTGEMTLTFTCSYDDNFISVNLDIRSQIFDDKCYSGLFHDIVCSPLEAQSIFEKHFLQYGDLTSQYTLDDPEVIIKCNPVVVPIIDGKYAELAEICRRDRPFPYTIIIDLFKFISQNRNLFCPSCGHIIDPMELPLTSGDMVKICNSELCKFRFTNFDEYLYYLLDDELATNFKLEVRYSIVKTTSVDEAKYLESLGNIATIKARCAEDKQLRAYLLDVLTQYHVNSTNGRLFLSNSTTRRFKESVLSTNSIHKVVEIYHGTTIKAVDDILRNGLKNMSGTKFQRIGAAYGNGVYTAGYDVAVGYSVAVPIHRPHGIDLRRVVFRGYLHNPKKYLQSGYCFVVQAESMQSPADLTLTEILFV